MKATGAGTVKIAEFKARLSHYLRTVRAGHALTVMDRQTPIARLTPVGMEYAGMLARKATKKPSEVKLPPPLKKKVDSLKWLLQDRNSGR
jgi:prevent-host-death family protein